MREETTWEEILQMRDLKKFPLVNDALKPVYRNIYPLMQMEVKAVMDALATYNISVIIFGSALTMRCNVTSDLDICIRTKEYDLEFFHEIQKIILNSTGVDCDVIYYNDLSADDRIKKEIDTNGFCIKEMR